MTATLNGALYRCCDDERRALLRASLEVPKPNGIDFLEVVDVGAQPADRQRVLRVHLVNPRDALDVPGDAVHFEGGRRVRDIELAAPPTWDGDVLVLRVAQPGDFSIYTLRLTDAEGVPVPGLDPLLCAVDFSFKVQCPSDFDCAPACDCPPERYDEPEIDYLVKDYASFRQALLDRLALLVPEWAERNAADVGVTLVELLAYAGDQLSYHQDAVATEAYLGTARRRVSVRRHAMLVDYAMRDGCNARAWVHLAVDAAAPADLVDGIALPEHTQLLTQLPGRPPAMVDAGEAYADALEAGPEVFETLHDATLWPQHDELAFHAWGGERCCLPAGATRASLVGDLEHLAVGDLLLLEEVLGPETGQAADADPRHRHVVRLTAIDRGLTDPLFADPDHPGQKLAVTEVAWGVEDALAFPLCLSAVTDAAHGARPIANVSVARGNIVLADHGRTIAGEDLGSPVVDPARPAAGGAGCGCETSDLIEPPARFAPRLAAQPLTQAGHTLQTVDVDGRRERRAFDPTDSAASALAPDPDLVLPAVTLEDDGGRTWRPRRDLVSSDPFAPEVVAEIDDEGVAWLRFGDGEYGQRPAVGTTFSATYRIGNGTAGNVGADTLAHAAVHDGALVGRIRAVRNPLPASGGTDPESAEHARQSAPAAFRTLERAVTPEDYATLAERHPEVQRAQAQRRWTGSWATVFLTVDRLGGRTVDKDFEAALRVHLERYRMAGHDLEIDGPRFVDLEVELAVCVKPGYFRSDVATALLEALGSRALPDGRRGAFHPDNFSFGQPVRLGPLYAVVQAVPGVAYAEFTTFQRLGAAGDAALQAGALSIGRLEIARLDNDPSLPERGVLRLTLEGGR